MGRILPQELRKALYAEAMRLASEGLGYRRIARELRERFGASVSMATISFWVRGLYTPYYRRRLPSKERINLYYEAKRLHKEGYGCRKIAKMLSISPSTVKDWAKGRYSPFGPRPPELPLPAPRSRTHYQRIQRISLEPSPALAHVIGAVLGDGYVIIYRKYQKIIGLNAKDPEFVEESARCLTSVLGRPVKVRFWKARGLFVVRVRSATLYRLLRKPVDLDRLRPFIEHCEECMTSFLRGFVDSEGSVSEHGIIYIYNTDFECLNYVKGLFEQLGIKVTGPYLVYRAGTPVYDPRTGKMYVKRKDLYILRISARSAHVFYQKVGLTIVRKRQKLEEYLRRRGLLPTPFSSPIYAFTGRHNNGPPALLRPPIRT